MRRGQTSPTFMRTSARRPARSPAGILVGNERKTSATVSRGKRRFELRPSAPPGGFSRSQTPAPNRMTPEFPGTCFASFIIGQAYP